MQFINCTFFSAVVGVRDRFHSYVSLVSASQASHANFHVLNPCLYSSGGTCCSCLFIHFCRADCDLKCIYYRYILDVTAIALEMLRYAIWRMIYGSRRVLFHTLRVHELRRFNDCFSIFILNRRIKG